MQKKLLTKIFNLMKVVLNFPGGTVDNNLPAEAGDTGLIPGGGSSTCNKLFPKIKKKHEVQI